MPINKIEGVVLKDEQLKERDKIISLYTRDFGLINVNAKGKKWGSRLEKGSIIQSLVYHRRGYTLIDCELSWIPSNIYKDLGLWCKASLLLESVYKAVLPGEKNLQLYNLLTKSLKLLNEFRPADAICLAFLLKVVRISGYYPVYNKCQRCSSHRTHGYLSYSDGGYVCSNCFPSSGLVLLDNNDFDMLDMLNSIDLNDINDSFIIKQNLFSAIIDYYEYVFESKLYSTKVIEQIQT
ncbi:MAG: DNA repair protein RecO [candidate division WS2 bacterium]|nr:DNA repair protein RecO [Candidatus Lithacetigena glycinireducens]